MKANDSWLLLMHQIAPQSDSFRVKMWRSILKSGALQLKNSVYALPAGSSNRQKFEAIVQAINSGQGDAFLCESKFISGLENELVVSKFNEDRSKRYRDLASELREIEKRLRPKKISESILMDVEHSIGKLERQFGEIKAIDFFECKEERPTSKLLQAVLAKMNALKVDPLAQTVSKNSVTQFQGLTWVTRADVHEDRIASIWLISKFIDKKPTFKFVKENGYRRRRNEIRFDMFNGEFTHVGDKCTFEVLVDSFSLKDQRLSVILEIIHDLDLKDTKYNRPETAGIGLIIGSIIKTETSDKERVKKANALFDDLYLSLPPKKEKKSTSSLP